EAVPDAEAVDAYTGFAVVFHVDAKGVAESAVDRRGAFECRMLVIAEDADECDRGAFEGDVVGFVGVVQVAFEAVVAIRLSVEVEVQVVADQSTAGDLAGVTDNRRAGRGAGHAFVGDRRDDVEAADRALCRVGVIPGDGEFLGRAAGGGRGYGACRLCAVPPVDAGCVVAAAVGGSWIVGIWLRPGRVGEGRQCLRAGVGADVGLEGEAAAGARGRVVDVDGERLGVGLSVEGVRDRNRAGVRSLFAVSVALARQRSRAGGGEGGIGCPVAPIDIHRPRASVRI